jgi:hypothetical protein
MRVWTGAAGDGDVYNELNWMDRPASLVGRSRPAGIRRDPFAAAMMAVYCPGLGHLYGGAVLTGLAILFGGPAVSALVLLVGLRLGAAVEAAGGDFGATVGCYALACGFLGFIVYLWQIWDAVRVARSTH